MIVFKDWKEFKKHFNVELQHTRAMDELQSIQMKIDETVEQYTAGYNSISPKNFGVSA